LSPVGSPIYTSCKSEETNPRFHFPPLLVFSSPNNCFSQIFLHHISKKFKGHHFSLSKFLKTLFLTPEVHPPDFQWLWSEEVAPKVEEEVAWRRRWWRRRWSRKTSTP
jgi:hypothetical protein